MANRRRNSDAAYGSRISILMILLSVLVLVVVVFYADAIIASLPDPIPTAPPG